jgi:hypothetical protein
MARMRQPVAGENLFCGFDRGTLTQFAEIQNQRAISEIEANAYARSLLLRAPICVGVVASSTPRILRIAFFSRRIGARTFA